MCVCSVFPYNHIENDDEFLNTIAKHLWHSDSAEINLTHFSDKVFNPFDLNDSYSANPLDDNDPDLNFYNEIHFHCASKCTYLTESKFKEYLSSNIDKHSLPFSICHLNIRSLSKNLADFMNFMECLDFRFSVFGFSETWLKDNNCDVYGIQGYSVVEKHRKSTCGGGVAIYVKHGIDYFHREDLSGFDDCMESVFIEIPKDVFKLGKNVIIGTIYRPPGTDITQFNKKLEAVVVKIQKENKKCYIMDDYNINLLNYDVHNNTAEFTDMMYANSFIPLVTRPTRITQSSATLIDNIFTNDLENLATSMQGILVADITDHFPVAYINTEYSNLEKEITVLKRVSTARNRTLFLNAISNLDWSDIYSSSDTQSAFSAFHEKLIKLYDMYIPKQKVQIKYNTRKPWLSDGLKNAIRQKNKLYRKSVKIRTSYNKVSYKTYQRTLKKIMLNEEKRYYANLLATNRGNMKKTWVILKGIVNKNKFNQSQSKFKLSDGTITNDKYMICEKFNEFFVSVGPNLAKKIPKQDISPLSYLGEKMCIQCFLSQFP